MFALQHTIHRLIGMQTCDGTLCVQEEMEALLGKACKQAVSSLAQMGSVLADDNSRHVCGVSTTRMLCPDLIHQLDIAVRCLKNIPIILERTLQVGRENEFYFEVICLCSQSYGLTYQPSFAAGKHAFDQV